MTRWNRGDVVLVRFVFADENGAKLRPAVILSGQAYHAGRPEVIVAAVTSNVDRVLFGDHRVVSWRDAGLPLPSLVTGILRTIKQAMILRRIGALSASDLAAVDGRVLDTLQIQAPATSA
jgi:mRNA interferase MazF